MSQELQHIMEELLARFILNLPLEELDSKGRFGFQLEQAFWFYEDFYRLPENAKANHSLPKYTFKEFSSVLLAYCPIKVSILGLGLPPNTEKVDDLAVISYVDEFYEYKSNIPTCGAIILNETNDACLLVRGWTSGSSWGFPKGKASKDEHPHSCAAREVYEEVSFDITPYIRKKNFLESHTKSQYLRLYIITNVKGISEFPFAPRTRKEIGDIKWHSIRNMTTTTNASISNSSNPTNTTDRYYNVKQFLKPLKKFIKNDKRMCKDKSDARQKAKVVTNADAKEREENDEETEVDDDDDSDEEEEKKENKKENKEKQLSERILKHLMTYNIPSVEEMIAKYKVSSAS